MASYNYVVLVGNVTRNIELSYTTGQTAVASFGIAVNKKYKSKSGEKMESVLFIDCVAFGKTAETLNKYVSKGNPILISGELQLDSWTTQEGQKRSKHKVLVQNFQFLPTGEKREEQTGNKNPEHDENYKHPDDDIPF